MALIDTIIDPRKRPRLDTAAQGLRRAASHVTPTIHDLKAALLRLPAHAVLAGYDPPGAQLHMRILGISDGGHRQRSVHVAFHEAAGREKQAILEIPHAGSEEDGLTVDPRLVPRLRDTIADDRATKTVGPFLFPLLTAAGAAARAWGDRSPEERRYGRHGARLHAALADKLPADLRPRFEAALAAKPI